MRKIYCLLISICLLIGCNSLAQTVLSPGNIIVPHERNIHWKTYSVFADSMYQSWASKTLDEDKLNGKGNAPRIILAKLLTKKDVGEVNRIMMKLRVWGVSGSTWAMNKNGDYDFTITPLTTILYLFGDRPELLYPETKKYLLNTLLSESGNNFRTKAPNSLGLAPETENHILMTEGSRYLKNRWIMLHGDSSKYYNNVENGMEETLINLLQQMQKTGLYEFNSLPYIGYTITALLNLEAFASEKLRIEARNLLDFMNWSYALGSYQLKHYAPMRRRYEKASFTALTTDYQSVFMKSWLSYSPVEHFNTNTEGAEVHALMGACLPYRPADKVIQLLFDKKNGYEVQLGHGKDACPELYTAGRHFLLSAGGVNRGERSIIVARPITLFLDDTATALSQTFHLAGPGTDFMKWNNTGVYRNFACAAGPVIIPSGYIPIASNHNWSVFSGGNGVNIVVYSTEHLGIMIIYEGKEANSLLASIVKANPDAEKLNDHFTFPEGDPIYYDVNAPQNKWVIKSYGGEMPERNFDQWPLINGRFH